MSKRILPLLIFPVLFLFLVAPASAAPGASLSTTPDRRYVYLNFSDLRPVSRVDYTLTYDTSNRTTGLAGGVRTKKFTSRTTRRQILGTCSGRSCTFHKSPKNITLQATFYLRSGGTTTVTKTLP